MRRIFRLKLLPWLCIVLGVGGLLVAGGLFLGQSQQSLPNSILSDPSPSAVRPSTKEVDSYSVAPSLPRYISIPAIGLEKSRIKHLGSRNNSEIASPDNMYDTGWYGASARPGQDGAMFIYGHLSSWEVKGVFHDLKKLRPGDAIVVQRGDGKVFTYHVYALKTYQRDTVDMSKVLSPPGAGQPKLTLMTCAGDVIDGTNDFTERLVVFASLND